MSDRSPLDTSSDSKILQTLGKLCFAATPVVPFFSQKVRADMMDGLNRFVALLQDHWVAATVIGLLFVGHMLLSIGSARYHRLMMSTVGKSVK